jgi:hypothetical protein
VSKWGNRWSAIFLVSLLVITAPLFLAALWQLLVADNNPILGYLALGFGAMIIAGISESIWGWFQDLKREVKVVLVLSLVVSLILIFN